MPRKRLYSALTALALLALATGFNFGAFFLYISSAPAFVQTLLGLGTLGYPWFFVPCIASSKTRTAALVEAMVMPSSGLPVAR